MAKKRKGITESRAAQHERKNSVSGSDESTCNHPEGSFHIPELPIEQTMSSGLVIANKGPEEVGENSDDGSDQSEEAWEVNDEFEGQIDPSIFPTPGEHIAFVYCKYTLSLCAHSLSDHGRHQVSFGSFACP
jgi:hypothetical protein